MAQSIAPPFYYLFNIKQIFSPYKVVWKEIAGAISGKGVFIASVSSQVKFSGRLRSVIPDHKLLFIPFSTAEEAYYVCGVLNSNLIRLIVASYTIETAMGTHILKNLRIPKFNSTNALHLRIALLSRNAHDASKKEIENIEKKIDKKISLLYGLSDAESQNVIDSLKILVP